MLSLETGFVRDYDSNPYGGYEKSERLLFPLGGEEDTRLSRKTKVLGLRFGEVKKAYVLDDLRRWQVVNDVVAGVPIVLIASPNSDSVRVYERKNHRFKGSIEAVVEPGTNTVWKISEGSLSHPSTGESLSRISSVFVSFWFAWFQFYPDTLFFDGPADDEETVGVHPNAQLSTTWGTIKR